MFDKEFNTVINENTVNILGDMYTSMKEINNITQKIADNISNTYNTTQNFSSQISNSFNFDNIIVNIDEITSQYANLHTEQNQFNTLIEEGEKKSEGLLDKIKGTVNELVNLPSISDMLNYSDNMLNIQTGISYMNDGSQSNDELQDKIYGASMRSRTDIGSMTETAGDLSNIGFSNDEAIQFTENLNKLFAIAGTGQEAQTSATNEMVSALENGVVSSEELSSMLSTAPEIVNAMAENMNIPVEEMVALAEQGQFTSDILKNSMLGATDSINAQFGNVKASWSDTMTNVGNMAMVAFEPVGNAISSVINSEGFANTMSIIGQGMAMIAPILGTILSGVMSVANFIASNWSIVVPIILGIVSVLGAYIIAVGIINTIEGISTAIKSAKTVATLAHAIATGADTAAIEASATAQQFLNASILACPITWIIVAIIALIAIFYAVIGAINKFAGTSFSATGLIAGAFMTVVAVIWNLLLGLADFILGIISALINPFISIANFIGNVFTNPISSIIYLFRDLAVNVLSVIKTIASAIDKVFGTNMAGTVDGWIDGVNTMADKAVEKFAPDENYEQKYDKLDLSTESLGLKRMNYGDSFDSGYDFGEGLTDFSMPDMSSGLGDFGVSTGDVDYSNMFEGTGITENTVNGINRSTEETGTNTYDISNNTLETGVNTENIADNTKDLGTNAENISNSTLNLENSNNELVNIGKSILGIMQENMENGRGGNNSSVVIDMRYMSNNVKSQDDADNLIERIKSEIAAGLTGKTEGAGGSVFASVLR